MIRVSAIAGLTLRSAIRSRVFIVLIVLVLVSIIGLPLVLKSDGTLAGQVQLFLHYVLGFTIFFLSVAATWAGAGAVSLDIEGQHMDLVMTKPVYSFQVWLGKWVGLMVMNIILLGLSGVLIYGMLRWSTRSSVLSADDRVKLEQEILTARKAIFPFTCENGNAGVSGNTVDPDGPNLHGNHREDSELHGDGLDTGMTAVSPGGTTGWRFKIPSRLSSDNDISLKFHFISSKQDMSFPVNTLWLVGPEEEPDRYQRRISCLPNTVKELAVPEGVALPGQVLCVRYTNIESLHPVTVLFRKKSGIKLLIREGGFESNYFRGLLLVMIRLAFFSALGLTVGVMFSFPVAVFSSAAFLLIAYHDMFIKDVLATGLCGWYAVPGTGLQADILRVLIKGAFVFMNVLVPPLTEYNPLNFLPEGTFISWKLVIQALLVVGMAYCSGLCVIGSWLLSRREIGQVNG